MKKFLRFLIFSFLVLHSILYSEKETVFITGAAGFIGSNFLEYMFEKYPDYQYIVLDALTYAGNVDNIPARIWKDKNFKFVYGSITNTSLVHEIMQQVTLVVHFAAETHVTRSIASDYVFFETDVLGTRALMEALVKNISTVKRFIHISTSEVYGTADYQPMDENHPLKARSPYAAAKVGADRLVYAYGCTYNAPVVIVRPFNNYGPKQHLEKVIPRFITCAIEGKPLTIHGNGSQARDWVHTFDMCRAIDNALHKSDFCSLRNQEINVGTGRAISIVEIAKMILKYFDLPESYITFVGDRPGQVDLHISSTDRAKKLLDWQASIEFEEGLIKTIRWYEKNPDYWKNLRENMLVKIKSKNGDFEFH